MQFSRKRRSSGMRASDWRRATRSRGVAMPSVTRLANRSRSCTPRRFWRISSRSMVCDFQFRHGIETRCDFAAIAFAAAATRRAALRAWPMPVAVSADCARSRGEPGQCCAELLFHVERRGKFEIAQGHRVEHHRVLLLVIADGIEMQQGRGGLAVSARRRLTQVMDQRARCAKSVAGVNLPD